MSETEQLTPSQYAAEYEFRGDGGDYTPNEGERILIEDAICGYLAEIESRASPAASRGENIPAREVREKLEAQNWKGVASSLFRLTKEQCDVILAALPDAPVPANDGSDDDDCRCEICGVAFKPDDECLTDIDMGPVHAACCGPEREGYVNLETGEPLGPDEPLPTPYKWGVA